MSSTRTHRRESSPIDRKNALVAEESYFERMAANMNATLGIYNPADNRTYDAGGRNRVTKLVDERSTEVKALIKKLAEKDLMRTYEETPKNNIVLYEIAHKELLSTRSVKVVVAGASFSPTEELIKKGQSSRRASAEELSRVKDLIATQPNVFYYIGAFSTTGWESSCQTVLVGGNFLIALIDVVHEAWRTYYAPDTRWRASARIFDLTTEEEKFEAIQRFAKRHTFQLLMDELTEDYVFDELGYPIPIIREAFELMANEDRFLRFETSVRPFRLIRIYG